MGVTSVSQQTFLPEWYPQSGVMLTWPHRQTDWAPILPQVEACYLELARQIAGREQLLIVTPEPERVGQLLVGAWPAWPAALQRTTLLRCPTDDTWTRDHGPLSVLGADGRVSLLDFRFNGWGGKFPAQLDNDINRRLMQSGLLRADYVPQLDFELEGGSLEVDDDGTLLTTEQCLLNPNRGAHRTREQVEQRLRLALGVRRVLWLTHGALLGDDTDSHIDTLARLCPDHTILYTAPPARCPYNWACHPRVGAGPARPACGGCPRSVAVPMWQELAAMEQELRALRTPQGQPYRLLPLPLPSLLTDSDGQPLPATYANYLVMNSAVLCPTYGQCDLDAQALRQISRAFPSREVVGVDCRVLIQQHGSLHCSTMQLPRGVLTTPTSDSPTIVRATH